MPPKLLMLTLSMGTPMPSSRSGNHITQLKSVLRDSPTPIGGGSVSEKGRQTFEGNAYDLVKHSAPVPKKIYGAPWDENVEVFWANHYFKPADEETPGDFNGWLKASRPNSYIYGGKVKPGTTKEGSNTNKHARDDVESYLSSQGGYSLGLVLLE